MGERNHIGFLRSGVYLLLSFFALISSRVDGQVGAPLLSHYRDSRETENQSWAICRDENDVMLFASRRGITTFDGQSWGFIPLPTIPGSMAYREDQSRVYVGGENDYGYLSRDKEGSYNFVSLSEGKEKTGLITRIIFTDSTVYFYGEQSISRHNLQTGKLEMRLLQKDNRPFTGMFCNSLNTFINVDGKGLYRLEADTLFPLVTGYMLENIEVLFSLPYNERMVLLGLGNGNLSLFDGIKFYVYNIRDNGYLKQNGLSDGIEISDSLYAFSTLGGGALVVAKKSGALRKAINYERGLPDDEIFALGTDNNNGLWLSHQYGLTRAELILPVGNFTMYKGLTGNLINSLWYDNELYVATSEGVFYLSQVKNFEQQSILVKQDNPPPVNASAPAEISADQLKKTSEQDGQKNRKSVLSRLFGKKTTESSDAQQGVNKPATGRQKGITAGPGSAKYVVKTVSRLKSVNYEFKKCQGLDDKCKQLVATSSGILASTNKGLFVIRNHEARPLVADRYINSISSPAVQGKFYIATLDGYFTVEPEDGRWRIEYPDSSFTQPVYSVVPSDQSTLWAGLDEEVIKITTGEKPVYSNYKIQSGFPLRYYTNFQNDTLYVFSSAGVFYYDKSGDKLLPYFRVNNFTGERSAFVISQPDYPFVRNGEEWISLGTKTRISQADLALLKIFDNIVSIVPESSFLWVITGDNQIYRVALNTLSGFRPDLGLFIKSIRNDKEDKFSLSDIIIRPSDNFVYFDMVAPAYLKENSIQYQWKVDKLMDNWSPWQTNSRITAPFQYGTFTIQIRAKDIWGNISEIKSYTYTRKAPFTRTRIFFVGVVTMAVVLLLLIIRFREKQLKKEKHILEEKVKERTAEIAAQKEEITSSIEYASRIQLAMLPVREHFEILFPDHFIFFKPRDIVSGDFYWIGEDNDHIFITVADCTGHGVPGAFMSTLGVSTLNEIITNKKDLHANTVLNLLREKIKTSLHQTGKEGEAADGMDVSFCVLHKNRKLLEYAGAFNPLLIVQGCEIKEYKADRMPIGIYVGEKDSFTNYEINVREGDSIYLFSDGLTDQFGGPEGAKFKRSNLKKLLLENCSKPMAEQGLIIENEFNKWKGKGEQIDDITVLGLRI